MVRTGLFIVALLLLAFVASRTVRAQADCDDVYGSCMATCANDGSAERCMQRCQGSRNRCSRQGPSSSQGAGFLRDIPLDQSSATELSDQASHQAVVPTKTPR
jgi:hypothetical protein